jgi:hypothetical protein
MVQSFTLNRIGGTIMLTHFISNEQLYIVVHDIIVLYKKVTMFSC